MKAYLALATLASLWTTAVNSAAIAGQSTTAPGTLTLTATRIVPSLLPSPPYMTFVTETTVWTQYPVATASD
ncbi:hypothetical protein F5878DRAFT_605133 [Lentinula raphanica]|uniref:Uncharacterized protein n=1 Tax=Lentinula raphanica TaxID=153919 RepID=A0AA38PIH5_9AGAR|nr:hypothetical protein F5880DRAFT_1603855 [Lentinula raphanica]KAJ3843341.1 hypothetical protein F5878DRAFT_605133 [Lentinula raphanica]